MTGKVDALEQNKNTADLAVDGLVRGLAAGAGMAVVLLAGGALVGIPPEELLVRFNPDSSGGWLKGLLIHLSVSGIYGVVYQVGMAGLTRLTRVSLPGWLSGLVYGLALFGLALGLWLPGLSSSLADLPGWLLALGHMVYGLIIGMGG